MYLLFVGLLVLSSTFKVTATLFMYGESQTGLYILLLLKYESSDYFAAVEWDDTFYQFAKVFLVL